MSTNHMGVNEDELSLQVREAVKEGLDWMLGDYEEKTVVERQYRAEEYGAEYTNKDVVYIKQMKEEFYDKKNAYEMFQDRTHNFGYFSSKRVKDAEKQKAFYESKGYYVELFQGNGGVIYVKTTLNKDISIDTKVVISYSPIAQLGAETFDAEATPYGESDNDTPVRIIVGGRVPHDGKSTLMNLLEDKMNQYGIPVELRDLDFSSPTNLKAGFDPNRKTKDWTEELT